MGTSDVSDRIAQFICGAPPREIDPASVESAQRLLVDAVGVALAGIRDAEFAAIDAFVAELGTADVPAPLGHRVSPGAAALAYGAAIHLLDYDDILPEMGHSASVLVSAALAMGHHCQSSGAEVLDAIAVGAEVGARLGLGMNPRFYNSGWHPTAVLGAVGAAATAARLARLDPAQTANALGLAATNASGMKATMGSTGKCLQVGVAARTGVDMVLLASAGGTGNRAMFEPQYGGFVTLFAPENTLPEAFGDIGERSEFVRQGVRLKFLPCCGSIHSPVFATLDAVRGNGIDPHDIEAIITEVDPQRLPHTDRPEVDEPLQGKFSMQYCQATAAATGALTLEDFSPQAIREPLRRDLMKKVELRPTEMPAGAGPSTGSRAARVTVRVRGGREFTSYVAAPIGAPQNPASDADLDLKFTQCASPSLGAERTARLLTDLRGIERFRSVRGVVEDMWNLDPQLRPAG
ncbi:MmgE/PrpD family protein [Micromonospora sp. NPDC005087]|uniref:MmgE/PrpD family protein n=1 Tax=Micromonospora sp. NPDC005087 TaxID=3364225 RepID=UPI0036851D77